MTLLLTGASGFIGKHFARYNKDRYHIHTVSLQEKRVEDIDFRNIDTIVHAAGIAHRMEKIDPNIFFDVNTELTKKLAQAAKKSGVCHFIFTSTVKVYGEHQNVVLTENSHCEPLNDPYGQSKLDAEFFLKSIEDEHFKVSIIRIPLVYGAGAKGNLDKILKLLDNNMPMPFANIQNRRSMVYIDNLIELINTIIDQKAHGIFLATDAKPFSTTELAMTVRQKLNRPLHLFTMPSLLKWILKVVKPQLYIRLYESLEMNADETFKHLNFKPPYSFEEGIHQMVKHYTNQVKTASN